MQARGLRLGSSPVLSPRPVSGHASVAYVWTVARFFRRGLLGFMNYGLAVLSVRMVFME